MTGGRPGRRVLRGRVVTPSGVLDDGRVTVHDGRITAVESGPIARGTLDAGAVDAGTIDAGTIDAGTIDAGTIDAGTVNPATVHRNAVAPAPSDDALPWIVPGFVDIHVHGGGGFTFTTGDTVAARAAAEFHIGHGTTTMLASLVSSSPVLMAAATRAYAPLVADGVLAGIHYEGPYLAPNRCGAQNPVYLRDPDLAELTALLDLGGVAMVTLAPELPRALEAIGLLVDRGVIAAVGHTDATYDQTMAAVRAGASVATHLANGMRPIHHREPGPIVALLESPTIVCELVADGVHLHDAMLRHAIRLAGPDRCALVTDAMAAAGMPDGDYELGGLGVTVTNGVATLAPADSEGPGGPGSPAIAGSTLTMATAFRRVVHSGQSMMDAVRLTSTTPARVLGRADIGAIGPGRRADLVLLDEQLRVLEVLRNGEIVG